MFLAVTSLSVATPGLEYPTLVGGCMWRSSLTLLDEQAGPQQGLMFLVLRSLMFNVIIIAFQVDDHLDIATVFPSITSGCREVGVGLRNSAYIMVIPGLERKLWFQRRAALDALPYNRWMDKWVQHCNGTHVQSKPTQTLAMSLYSV